MGQLFENLIGGIVGTVVEFFNGLIVGVLGFIDGVLTSLDHLDDVLVHVVSSVGNFFSAVLTLGNHLFPFIPPEWMALIEAALIVLAIGMLIRKRVLG